MFGGERGGVEARRRHNQRRGALRQQARGYASDGGTEVVQSRRARRRVGKRYRGGRIEALPSKAREPHLHPRVGVVGAHLVQVGDRVVGAGDVTDDFAGGNPEGSQHDSERRGDLLAEPDPVPEEKLVDGVGSRGQGRNVQGVTGVRAHPGDERFAPGRSSCDLRR